MQRGRKPIPARLQEVKGAYKQHPERRRTSSPAPTGSPDCPEHLNAIAKTEWARITPELEALDILCPVDRAVLSVYCSTWSRLVEAEEHLANEGLVIRAGTGCPIQNPYVAIATKAAEQIRTIAGEFGLTPSSRMRLDFRPQGEEEQDEFAEFLKRAN